MIEVPPPIMIEVGIVEVFVVRWRYQRTLYYISTTFAVVLSTNLSLVEIVDSGGTFSILAMGDSHKRSLSKF
jgi:hypothetical protein